MLNILKMSEAASIALHAVVVIAANEGRSTSAKGIASVLQVSETHLSKVMQRLARAKLVSSTRGPGGGFTLRDKNSKLLAVYEAIDGKFITSNCLFEKPVCRGKKCIFGCLLKKMNRDFYEHLSTTALKDVLKTSGGKVWKIS